MWIATVKIPNPQNHVILRNYKHVIIAMLKDNIAFLLYQAYSN